MVRKSLIVVAMIAVLITGSAGLANAAGTDVPPSTDCWIKCG